MGVFQTSVDRIVTGHPLQLMAPGNAWSVHSPVTREISRYRSSVGSPNLDIKALLTCRSAVDQVTVNHPVVGSIPTMSAKLGCLQQSKYFNL